MTTITTRAGKGSALTYEEMDNNLSNLNNDKLEKSGGTMSGNITFSDTGEGIVFSDNTSITSAAGISGTTYSVSAESTTGGANVRLTGSDASTDDVKLAEGTGITVTRTDANTITIATTVVDTNTTYAISAETATGGANLRLTGSDASTDDVKLAEGTGITVTRTDANVITVATTALLNVVEDLTPQLGGNLDAMNYTISNVDVVSTDGVQLDTAANEAGAVGKLVWDDGEGGISYTAKGGNLDIVIGETNFALVHNGEATTLTKGEVVYAFGAQGNRISVKRAQADGDTTSARTLGIVAESITSGGEGFVVTSGTLKGVVTTGLTVGGIIYLSPTTAGAFTQTKPNAPDHLVYVGVVTTAGSNGRIDVKIQNGYELDEIHDVNINDNVAIADDHYLIYNSTAGLWENGPLDISDDTSPTLGGNLDVGSFTISSTTGALQLADAAITVGTGAADTVINGSGAFDLTLTTNNTTIANTAPFITFGHGSINSPTGLTDAADDGHIAMGGNVAIRGGVLLNDTTTTGGSALAGAVRVRHYPFSDGTNIGGGGHMTSQNYRDPTSSSTFGGMIVFGTQGNVAVQSRDSTSGNSTWAAVRNGFQVHATENMLNNDRWRGQSADLDVALNTYTWGTMSTASRNAPIMVGQQGVCSVGTSGNISHAVGQSGIVNINPAASSTITAQYATGQFVSMGINGQGSGATANVVNMRLVGGSIFSGNTSITGHAITNAIGLHITDGWSTVTGVTVTNKYAVLNEDSGSKIQTNGNLDVTGTTTVGTLNTGNVTTTGNLSVSAVMTVGNYASGSLPSGAVGSIIAINNNGGRLAYWDTTNSRWSYVADDSAV